VPTVAEASGGPDRLDLAALKEMGIRELAQVAKSLEIPGAVTMKKQELVFQILRAQAEKEGSSSPKACWDPARRLGFLRAPDTATCPGRTNIYVSPSQIRKFDLRTGDTISGQIRPPKDDERYFALINVTPSTSSRPTARRKDLLRQPHSALPRRPHPAGDGAGEPLHARARPHGPAGQGAARPHRGRAPHGQDDAPAGHRQRHHHQPSEIVLIVLLIDERPEEVTDMQRSVHGEVISSTFDEPRTGTSSGEMVLESEAAGRAQKDVVILLDSITRAGPRLQHDRAASGKVLSAAWTRTRCSGPSGSSGRPRNVGGRIAHHHRERAVETARAWTT